MERNYQPRVENPSRKGGPLVSSAFPFPVAPVGRRAGTIKAADSSGGSDFSSPSPQPDYSLNSGGGGGIGGGIGGGGGGGVRSGGYSANSSRNTNSNINSNINSTYHNNSSNNRYGDDSYGTTNYGGGSNPPSYDDSNDHQTPPRYGRRASPSSVSPSPSKGDSLGGNYGYDSGNNSNNYNNNNNYNNSSRSSNQNNSQNTNAPAATTNNGNNTGSSPVNSLASRMAGLKRLKDAASARLATRIPSANGSTSSRGDSRIGGGQDSNGHGGFDYGSDDVNSNGGGYGGGGALSHR
eukprot:CAMPEP_0175062878 /NCGR_PEP_ID=MMETSP0052_2-20121109/14420_1 /TAXON_ID=51329 ORGANISM="Polytomella parva, Strain SAG 63-3" /NCGR_SAMPLE_ID=MMETSP0052_2 /ASSEMBLY_ACC=CAM_ASM_000194 /LENGTH=293 /DNA_ID=CAMNT_0016328963 /DNA_START=1 /DNA_END=878 /DNA_ORIENTATION=-